MARYTVNRRAVEHAHRLIEARQYVLRQRLGRGPAERQGRERLPQDACLGRVRRLVPRADRGRDRGDQGPPRVRVRRLQADPPVRDHRLPLPCRRVATQGRRARGARAAPGARPQGWHRRRTGRRSRGAPRAKTLGCDPMRRLDFYIILTTDGMYADPRAASTTTSRPRTSTGTRTSCCATAGGEVMGRGMYDVMTLLGRCRRRRSGDARGRTRVRDGSGGRRRSTSSSRGKPDLRANATILEGDVVEAVRRLKEQDGPDLGLGCGADLFATLSEAGLIDTYRFLITTRRSARARRCSGR